MITRASSQASPRRTASRQRSVYMNSSSAAFAKDSKGPMCPQKPSLSRPKSSTGLKAKTPRKPTSWLRRTEKTRRTETGRKAAGGPTGWSGQARATRTTWRWNEFPSDVLGRPGQLALGGSVGRVEHGHSTRPGTVMLGQLVDVRLWDLPVARQGFLKTAGEPRKPLGRELHVGLTGEHLAGFDVLLARLMTSLRRAERVGSERRDQVVERHAVTELPPDELTMVNPHEVWPVN